jgi:hypothetical protein
LSRWLIYVDYPRGAIDSVVLNKRPQRIGSFEWKERQTPSGEIITVTLTAGDRRVIDVFEWLTAELKRLENELGVVSQPVSVRVFPLHVPERDLIPKLMTLAEIALALNVSRQRVREVARKRTFPAPFTRTSRGPLYAAHEIEDFCRARRSQNRGKTTDYM